MKRPLLSFIIPALNEEKFLPNLLVSLTEQTKRNFEVIVVDGKSRDKTVTVARGYKSKLPSLDVIVSEHANLPLQRNLGAKRAKGEWLVFVDADSVLLPYFVDRTEKFILTHKPQLFTPWASPDSEDPKDAQFTLFANVYVEATEIFKRPLAPGPLTIVHRPVFDSVGGYDETHKFHEDVDFGLRLFKTGVHLMILPETLYIWSLRRFRSQGTLRVINQYVISMLPVFFNRSFKRMPGYVMGGQLYSKKKKLNKSVLAVYERKLKLLLKELFV